jgi:hypothetical protein
VTTKNSDIDEAINIVLGELADPGADEIVEFANEIEIIRKDYAKKDVLSGEDFINIVTYSAMAAIEEPAADELIPLSAFADIPEDDEAGADIASVAAGVGLSAEAVTTLPRGGLHSLAEVNDSSLLARLSRSSANASGIQFRRIRQDTYFMDVPFETQRIESNQHFVGTEIVQTRGAAGTSRITAEISLIGDEEESHTIIGTEVITAPVTEVIIVGTRIRPSTNPSGSFGRPVRGGQETTQFGAGHRGLDIAAPFGTTIVASDGGTIIYAGFSGSYGNHVKIRHGNSYVTLYAHMSSMSVSQGDRVFKGQEIGKVGSTGRSTGNHVHFEIIRNGVQVNPKNYIN